MATNVSNLPEAMEAAGFKTKKELAEAAGVSYSGLCNILKRGTCNPSTAEALQEACGEHRIGPYMETVEPSHADQVAEELPDHVRFEGRPWFRDEVAGHIVITGTRKSGETGLIGWGAAVYDAAGALVEETSFTHHSFIPPRDEGAAIAKEANAS